MTTDTRTRRLTLSRPLDLRSTLAPFRFGKGDPSCLLRSDECFRTSQTPIGPATVHIVALRGEVRAEAWGEGADWVLDQLPLLLGEADDVSSFRPTHPLVAELHRRAPGLRLGATHRIFESLVSAVCGQQVSAYEARRAHRQIMQAYGEPAPGPPQLELLAPPPPRVLATAGFHDLHPLGLERARADVLRRSAARAHSLEALIDLPTQEVDRRLRSITGVGGWASAMVRQVGLGDPDAVPVGDDRLKHLVAFAFTGQRRGTDAQMLELLEPFRGHRGRVLRLLKASGVGPPRLGA